MTNPAGAFSSPSLEVRFNRVRHEEATRLGAQQLARPIESDVLSILLSPSSRLASEMEEAFAEYEYLRTKNPLWVWYVVALRKGGSLPAWVERYLEQAALLLLAEALATQNKALAATLGVRPERSIAASVARALRFKNKGRGGRDGRFNPFASFRRPPALGLAAAVAVDALPSKRYLAYEDAAAAAGVSKRTVIRAWREWSWLCGSDRKSATLRTTRK